MTRTLRGIALRVPLLAVGFLSVYFFYRASQLEAPSDAERAFTIGLILSIADLFILRSTVLSVKSAEMTALEERVNALSSQVRLLGTELERTRKDVHGRIAMKEWLEAMDRVDVKAGRLPHIHPVDGGNPHG